MAEVSGFGSIIPGSEINPKVFLNIFNPKNVKIRRHSNFSSGAEDFSGTLDKLELTNNCLTLSAKLENTTLKYVVPRKDLTIVSQPGGFTMFNLYDPNSPVWTFKK
jgi:hypothetical protein